MRGLFDGETFVRLCVEDYKLLTCSIKELIPAVRGPLVCDSDARRLVSKFGFFLFFSFSFPFLPIVAHYGEKRATRRSVWQNLYCKLLFNVPPPCVGAARVLFSRGKYTHPSIILFLTVFHYCLRKKRLKCTNSKQVAPSSTDNFKAKFTRFPAMICLLPI